MGFESRAISARVTKQIVTIFSKTCDNRNYRRVIVRIFTPPAYGALTWRTYVRYDNTKNTVANI